MLRGLQFDVDADLWVRFQKVKYVFVRFCNGVCVYVLRPHHRGASIIHSIVCVCMCTECICIFAFIWCACVCVFVCASMYMYGYLCMCIYVYASMYVCVFACGWIYGVGVAQPKTRYLTWRLQYRLQLMVKETLMFQRAKIEIIEVSVMLLEIVAWHELQ